MALAPFPLSPPPVPRPRALLRQSEALLLDQLLSTSEMRLRLDAFLLHHQSLASAPEGAPELQAFVLCVENMLSLHTAHLLVTWGAEGD